MMTRRLTMPLLVLAALGAAAFLSARPFAAAAPGDGGGGAARIAVVNPVRVFNELQETKSLTGELQSEGQRLADQEKEMVAKIKSLEDQRANLRADSPQYDELEQQWTKAVMEHEVWAKSVKVRVDRDRKRQVKAIYEKIYAAVAEVAQADGYDLVLSDHRPQLSDKDMASMTFEQLGGFINQRRVLYASQKVDVSQAVIAKLDAGCKANPAATAAPGGTGATGGSPRLPQPAGNPGGARNPR